MQNLMMHNFLIEKFGKAKADHIFAKQQIRLEELLAKTVGKTKNQMKTLRETIMPRIALYQILQEEGITKEAAYDIVKTYMVDVVSAKMVKKFKKFDKIPFVYYLLKQNIKNNLLKNDNWQATLVSEDKDGFAMDVHKCIWYDATVENGCPELCRAFCECDDILFDAFSKVDFYREGSLGMQASKCDFKFSKAKK